VTLVVDALLVVGGVALGRWIVRRVRASRAPSPVDANATPAVEAASAAATDLPAGLPCRLGDVVLRPGVGDEVWLAGALVLAEERPIAVIFVAPEAGGDRALFVRDVAGSGITWLSPLPDGAIAPTKEPPHAIELDGVRFERARRLPVRVSRVGTGAPSPGERAIVAEYGGVGADRVLVLAGAERLLAWRGVALGEGEYEVLPGSESTREA
jgi:hypothetical protein